jgi:AcrR family transcriptional regulator
VNERKGNRVTNGGKRLGHVTRRDIEEAAARVFRREGYRGSTVAQIAEEVGLHKTSLYYHVKSKQELLVSLARYVLEEPIQNLEAIAAEPDRNPQNRLYDAVIYYMGRVFDRTDAIAVFDLYAGDIEDKALRSTMLKMKKRYIQIFVDLVAECLNENQSSEDPELVAYAILGSCSYVVTWYQPRSAVRPTTLAHTFARTAIRAVEGNGSAPRSE